MMINMERPIIVAAAVFNGMELAKKKLEDIKIVTSGAGAAALACLNLLVFDGSTSRKYLGNRSKRSRI